MENPEYNVAAVVCEANNNHKPLVVQDDEFHDYIPVVIPESLGAPLSAHSRRSSSCTLSSLTPPPPRPPKPRQLTPPPISSSTSSESSLGSLRLPPRSVIPSPQESPHPKAEPSGPPQKISTGIRNKIELLLKSLNRVQSEMVQRKPPAVTHAVNRSTSAAASGVRYNWDEQPETSTSKLERPHRLSLIDQRISRRMIAIPHVSPASISAARDDGDRNHIKRTNKNQIVQCKNETDATLKNPVQRNMRKSSTSTQASNHTDVSDTNADQQQIFTPQSTPIPVIKLNDHHSDDHECLVIPPPPSSLPTPTPSIAPSTSFHDPRNDDRECKPRNDFKPNQIIVDEHDKKKETVSAEHGTLACVERTHEDDYETISDLETTPDALPTTICENIAKTNTSEPIYWAPVTLTIREDGHPAISFYGNPFEYLHRRLKSGLKQISAPPVSDNRPQPIASPTCKIRWSLVTFAIIVLLCIGGTIALAFYIAAKSCK
ncbi:unnamed protein product [Anisakis simplex]|uniref:Uncharacterized protein n=1 Tax=Anisakis simplex TaxID=6269 RepID=A0A0M3K5R7_ANISI|nr:unnamed protein product [Anisakis simplex]